MSILARNPTISNDKLRELKIDPEFRDKIPPLTDAEFEQLRENILKDGEVYEPICVWKGTIIDGHNRWRVIQENPEIPHRFKEMDFSDKWEAFEWMYSKQLGRRNLTDEQKTYMIGKMYEARKNSHGGNHGNQYTKVASAQNDPLPNEPKKRIADQIAGELEIGKETVKRSERFSKGVDALRQESPEAADIVLKGKSGLSKAQVSEIRNMGQERRKETAQAIVDGKTTTKKPVGRPQKMRELNKAIVESNVAARGEDKPPEYTVDDLCEEIVVNAESYVAMLKNTLRIRSTVINTDRGRVRGIVQKIIDDITKVRNLI